MDSERERREEELRAELARSQEAYDSPVRPMVLRRSEPRAERISEDAPRQAARRGTREALEEKEQEDSGGGGLYGSRKIPTHYTHQQLASMVGSNREAVTRAFGKLRKAGVVEIRERHIYVTDVGELGRYADAER